MPRKKKRGPVPRVRHKIRRRKPDPDANVAYTPEERKKAIAKAKEIADAARARRAGPTVNTLPELNWNNLQKR